MTAFLYLAIAVVVAALITGSVLERTHRRDHGPPRSRRSPK